MFFLFHRLKSRSYDAGIIIFCEKLRPYDVGFISVGGKSRFHDVGIISSHENT